MFVRLRATCTTHSWQSDGCPCFDQLVLRWQDWECIRSHPEVGPEGGQVDESGHTALATVRFYPRIRAENAFLVPDPFLALKSGSPSVVTRPKLLT